MYDVTYETALPIVPLTMIARSILGDDTSGTSVSDTSRIHLVNDTAGNRTIAESIFAGWGGLTVTASVATMTEGDADPTVTCADASIAGDVTVGYAVFLDGVPYDDGEDTVVSNESELTLVSPEAGVYDVYIWRLSGDYKSGHVQITVNEA